MLRNIRRALAVFSIIAVTALFLDFTGTVHAWLGWMAKIQFLPALLALNVGVIAALVVLTLLFGRLYCSVICPLGIMQDGFAWFGKKAKRNRYRYSPAKNVLRYSMLGVMVVAIVLGIGSLVALLAPYSAYGRIAGSFLSPLWMWGNNLLAKWAEHRGSYDFYTVDVWLKGWVTLIVAGITLVALAVLAWRNGRTYCNTICPVGTVLGFLSRFSLFKIVIDTSRCNGCGLCARNCKSACIDSKAHAVDYSRCVACMDCVGKCHQDAISFRLAKFRKEKTPAPAPDPSRRRRCRWSDGFESRGKGGGRWPGGHRGKEDTPAAHPHRSARCPRAEAFELTLHRLPAVRICMSQRSVAPVHRSAYIDAARIVLRARILPPRVHAMLRCVSCRCNPADRQGRQIVNPDRSCRVDKGKLRGADRRRQLRQLRPALLRRRHQDGEVRSVKPRFAQDSRCKRGALHWLRSMREPLSRPPVQCHICRGA